MALIFVVFITRAVAHSHFGKHLRMNPVLGFPSCTFHIPILSFTPCGLKVKECQWLANTNGADFESRQALRNRGRCQERLP